MNNTIKMFICYMFWSFSGAIIWEAGHHRNYVSILLLVGAYISGGVGGWFWSTAKSK